MLDLKRIIAAKPKGTSSEPLAHLATPWGEHLAHQAFPAREEASGTAARTLVPRAEHPRPQFQRDAFTCLNGWWTCTVTKQEYNPLEDAAPICAKAKKPKIIARPILVPFSPESDLSGIERTLQPNELLWYRASFPAPAVSKYERCLLHFEAVDDSCAVWCNNLLVGTHNGGYLPFTFDITDALSHAETPGTFTLELCVADPSEQGIQLRGKQKLARGDLWYTAQSGIWQPVWLEVVPAAHLTSVSYAPNTATGTLAVDVQAVGEGTVTAILRADDAEVGRAAAQTADGHANLTLSVARPHLWSPNDPFLYDVELQFDGEAPAGEEPEPARRDTNRTRFAGIAITKTLPFLGTIRKFAGVTVQSGDAANASQALEIEEQTAPAIDIVHSYVAWRDVCVKHTATGEARLFLNGEPFFVKGVLDQGYWPESLMTAPDDEAFVFDIENMRAVGFNTLRKHIKLEAERFYYHCDRLGMLVWQDMVTGGSGTYDAMRTMYLPTLFKRSWTSYSDTNPRHWEKLSADNPRYRELWTSTCEQAIHLLKNHPSIVTWVLFNEGWGQFFSSMADTRVREIDPTRPINAVSGWYDQGAGDYYAVHNYFRDLEVFPDHSGNNRALVTDEFGGLVHNVKGHAQLSESYGYATFDDLNEYRKAVRKMLFHMDKLEDKGLAGYVYTQLSDVEEETNGIFTYDRKVNKLGL